MKKIQIKENIMLHYFIFLGEQRFNGRKYLILLYFLLDLQIPSYLLEYANYKMQNLSVKKISEKTKENRIQRNHERGRRDRSTQRRDQTSRQTPA